MRSNPLLKATDRLLGRLAFAALRTHAGLRRLWGSHDGGGVELAEVGTVVAIKLCCLGDGILAAPALRALKTRWPSAQLVVVCTPRSAEAFRYLPFVDRIVELPVTGLGGMRQALATCWRVFPALRDLRRLRPAVAVDLDLYYRATPVLAYLTGAPVRVGFDTRGYNRAGLFTASVDRDREKWEAECFLDVVRLVGAPTDDRRLEFHVPAQVRQRVDTLLAQSGIPVGAPLLALCPGSSKNWPAKQWPAERFSQVADWAAHQYGLPSVLVGAGFEAELGQRVAHAAARASVINLAGKTSVVETAAVLQRAVALVTNDTGPMHLACAVGTPVVAIFGPTDERKWGPRGPRDVVVKAQECDCRPCYYLSYMPDCEHRRCLMQIPVDQVTAALAQVMASAPETEAQR